jgi:hypothetical protein
MVIPVRLQLHPNPAPIQDTLMVTTMAWLKAWLSAKPILVRAA